jgi:tetratricopeptide (TPR) repeat protein
VLTPLPDPAATLAEQLSARGFATGGFVGAFILDRPYGFAQGFETFAGFARVDSGTEANAERTADAVVGDAVRWLAGVPAEKPFFAWVHLYDAHVGYTPPSPFAPTYDGEIAFVDQQIGRLLEALRARGTLEDTLLVAIGDHGESLGEHGEDEHGVFLYDAVLRVPLIVAGPGAKAGQVVAEQVRAIDVVPTILELLDVPPATSVDGVSLKLPLAGGARAEVPASYSESYYPKLHYGWSELRAIRADGWKAVDAPKPELYNLREDPREQNNLYASQRALADRMIADAARLERDVAGEQRAKAVAPDPETLARLRSLGYIGTSAPRPDGARGPDPKDRIGERDEYNALMTDAIDDLRGGQPESAVPKFRRLASMNDRAYDVHQFLGEAYERLGRLDEALGEYGYAAVLNPEAVTPIIAAAEVHMKRGDLANARKRLAETARIEPDAYEVLMLRGNILMRERRPDEALAAFEKAVERNPANPRARAQAAGIAVQVRRWDRAEHHLRTLLEMRYQPSRTYFALGQVAQMQGRTAEASERYREALRLEPGLKMAQEALRTLR